MSMQKFAFEQGQRAALARFGLLKLAAGFKIPPRMQARMVAAGPKVAPEITHIVPAAAAGGGKWVRGGAAGEAALANSMGLQSIPIPQHVLDAAKNPALQAMPKARPEMPHWNPPTQSSIPAAQGSPLTKSKPTMSVDPLPVPAYMRGSAAAPPAVAPRAPATTGTGFGSLWKRLAG